MALILALDQGTSSSRSIVFDAQGHIVASAQQEIPQHYPQPGWVEHDPMTLWTTQRDTARQALQQAATALAREGRSLAELRAHGHHLVEVVDVATRIRVREHDGRRDLALQPVDGATHVGVHGLHHRHHLARLRQGQSVVDALDASGCAGEHGRALL